MSSIDEQFVEFIVKSLVGNPDEVVIERTIDEKGVLLELTVDPEDLGRVIGKRGATAQSMRTLLRALGTKNDARYNLKIIDNGVPQEERAPREENSRDDSPQEDTSTNDDDSTSEEADEPEEVVEETVSTDDTSETLAEKTRKELSDLDDLDI